MSDRWADTERLRRGQDGRRADRRRGRPADRSRRRSRCCGSRGRAGATAARSPTCSRSRSTASSPTGSTRLLGDDRGLADRRRPAAGAARPSTSCWATPTASGAIVYLVSDFRARQWDDPAELRKQLLRLERARARRCTWSTASIAPGRTWPSPRWRPAEGIRAAGVPLFMEVAVQNFGAAPAQDVSGRRWARTATPGRRSRSPRFRRARSSRSGSRCSFPTAGEHRITARLESDAVAADNYRYCVDRSAGRRAGAADRRRRRGPRRPLPRAGPWRPAGRCARASGRRSRRPAT